MLQKNLKANFKYIVLIYFLVSCSENKTNQIIIEPITVLNRTDTAISRGKLRYYKIQSFLIHNFIRGDRTKAYVDSFVERIRQKNLPANWEQQFVFFEYSSENNIENIKEGGDELDHEKTIYLYKYQENDLIFIEYKNGFPIRSKCEDK